MKITRQGVLDLGGNQRQPQPRCRRTGRHWPGPREVVGQAWKADEEDYYLVDVYGARCIHCRCVMP